jgi:hypothetical protein
MAGITLAQAEAKLAEWMAADTAVASGQAYKIHGREMTRANAAEIMANIEKWDGWCRRLGRSGIRVRLGTPS